MKYIYISRTTQRTNSGQIPACSQEPVDSTDANMVETSTCLETTQQETREEHENNTQLYICQNPSINKCHGKQGSPSGKV